MCTWWRTYSVQEQNTCMIIWHLLWPLKEKGSYSENHIHRNEIGFTSSLLKVKVGNPLIPQLIHLQQFEDTEVKMLGVVEGGLCCQQYCGLNVPIHISGQMDWNAWSKT